MTKNEFIKKFKILKTDDDLFYFNYISMPDQILEKWVDEYSSEDACDFFETDEEEAAIAGFAYSTHNENEKVIDEKSISVTTGTITIQGIINFDEETLQIVSYNEGDAVLGKKEPISDYGISEFGSVYIDDAKTRLSLFTEEWGISWETSEIYDNELEEY